MIICKKCGNHNQDEAQFCSACGSFLEWSGEPVKEAEPRAEASTDAPAEPAATEDLEARRPDATLPPRQSRVPRTTPPGEPEESGVFCSRCGVPNDTRRHFCRRCGAPLAVLGPVRTPWYRRLLPRRRDPAAGERPRGPSISFGSFLRRFVVTVLLVAVVGGLLAYAGLPGFRNDVNRRIDMATTGLRSRLLSRGYTAVRPEGVRASSELPGHPAGYAADLIKNDYWAADTGRDPHPTLEFTFDGKTDLDALLITSGASGTDFAALARPKTVQLTYSDGRSQQLTLKDDPTPTTYTVYARGTTVVSMQITSVYPVSGSRAVAIAEVEFYRLH